MKRAFYKYRHLFNPLYVKWHLYHFNIAYRLQLIFFIKYPHRSCIKYHYFDTKSHSNLNIHYIQNV